MLFLLDENVHAGVLSFLKSAGHDATRVPSGIKNGEVIRLSCAEGRILVTHDKDFLEASRRFPKDFPGVICIRIHPPTLQSITAALGDALADAPELSGGVFALDEAGLRRI